MRNLTLPVREQKGLFGWTRPDELHACADTAPQERRQVLTSSSRLSRTCLLYMAVMRLLWPLLLATRCLASPVPANDLLVRSWSPGADGRQQSVQALLATRDGYLWVGTGKGLMRFDGVSFTAFTAENTAGIAGDDISFNTLWEDEAGVLWAGTYGRGVIRDDHGRFATLDRQQGLADSTILRIDGDGHGGIWAYTERGVSRWHDGRFEQVHPDEDGAADAGALIEHDNRRTIDFARMGLWRHTPVALERFAYGAWHRFPTPTGEDRTFEHDVRSIYEDHLRRVWYSVASQPGRYFCARDRELTIYDGLPVDAFVTYQDREGFLWINDHGAHPARWKQGKLYPLPALHTPFLLNVVERRDGTIWAGSSHSLLLQYRPRLISSIKTAGIPEIGSALFQQRDGTIWAGGTELLQLKGASGTVASRPSPGPLFSGGTNWDVIDALSEDAEGHLLLGLRHHLGGALLSHGRLTPYLARGFDHSIIRAMLLSPSGAQWIGTDSGLYLYDKRKDDGPKRLWSGAVRCLARAGSQAVWVGTKEGPLRFEDGRQLPLEPNAAWNFGEVQSISLDSLGDLWMATSQHGIVRFAQGAFRAFGTEDGLPTDNTYSVNFGDDDDLWIRSDVGLMRIRRRSIQHLTAEPASKLQVTLFDQTDGLPTADMEPGGNQGFLHLDGGVFWFATPEGIASLRPSAFITQPSSPRAVLEEHAIDQAQRLPGANIVLAPGQRNLEFHYTALGSKRPEQLIFRYRLRGFDQGWTAAGTRRVAYYTQLPPGRYHFEVQAAEGDDDVWSPASAAAEVRVLTPFYRTWWMMGLLCCIVLSALYFFTETRRRVVADRTRMRQAFTHKLIATQEGERKRIAHELHDSLGQHLVLIRTLAMLPKPSVTQPGADHLSKIADQAAVAIQEVENISYDLRPYQLDRLGLTKTIISFVESFAYDSPFRVTHSIENIDGFFPKDMEINVYRIVQEAFGNILKHAEATEVTVIVKRVESALRLVVADNGRGFHSSVSGSTRGGLGLIGIEERAEALGGHAVIESGDYAGTKVTVTVTRT